MRRRPWLRIPLALAQLPLLQACAPDERVRRPDRVDPSWPERPRHPDAAAATEMLAVEGPLNLLLEQGAPGAPRIERPGSEALQLRREQEGLRLVQPDGRGARARLSQPVLRELRVGEAAQVRLGLWRAESLVLVLSGSGSLEADRVEARHLRLQLLGSGAMELGALRCERLEVLISGSGALKLGRLRAEELEARLRASGDFSVAGQARQQQWHLSGSGDVRAAELSGEVARLRSFGSGDASLGALESLEAALFGSGDLVYAGQPRLSQRSLGSGRVRPR
jgi:hypothetical protein